MHTCPDENTSWEFQSVPGRSETTGAPIRNGKSPTEDSGRRATPLEERHRTGSNHRHRKNRFPAGETRSHSPVSISNDVLPGRDTGWSPENLQVRKALLSGPSRQRATPEVCSACCAEIIS